MKRWIAVSAFALLVAGATAHAQETAEKPGLDLFLRCDGTATHVASETTYANAYNNSGQSASGNATSYRKERFSERILLDLNADGGRVRVPKAMVPPLNSGGKDGWWTLSDVTASADNITAHFRLNPINKPTIRIDRSTGDIDMSGFGMAFRGTCERQERQDRRF